MIRPGAILWAALLALMAAGAAGQAAGPSYFVAGSVAENGGLTRDGTYTLIGQVGGTPVGGQAVGTLHVVTAGFPAVVDPVVSGSAATPWPMTVQPRFVDLSPTGDAIFTLRGAELLNGGLPSIYLGGRYAPIISAGGSSMIFTLMRPVVPGWRRLDLVTARGTISLPEGVGVRPMLALAEPAAPDRAVRLVVHARPGDMLLLGASWGLGPPRKIAPFHHVLRLSPALWIFLGAFPVTAPDGKLSLTLPSIGLTTGIHLQGLVQNLGGGYDPGSFTNALAL